MGDVVSMRPGKSSGPPKGATIEDFYALMPAHKYIFAPTRDLWPAASVNGCLPPVTVQTEKGEKEIPAAQWLDSNRHVEQMTWVPGRPMLIKDRLIASGGWIERPGATCFNVYRGPTIRPGDPNRASKWIEHVAYVYRDAADHIIRWLAHRVQRPDEKINHALVLGGKPGVGKDTLLHPVAQAVGSWNWSEVSPKQVVGRFNGFLKSVVLRISEARDLGDVDRFGFYESMKTYIAAPPDTLRADEKNAPEYDIPNVTGVIITTNNRDGLYLPPDDRRHFVAWSDLAQEDFPTEYWRALWRWYDTGGVENVAAYLASVDLRDFDPKAPPAKTDAFWAMVSTNSAPEDAELADVLDHLGSPPAVTLAHLQAAATDDLLGWLRDRKNRRAIPHRLEKCGYIAVRNESAKDGLWVLRGKRQAIYARSDFSSRDRHAAVICLLGD